MTTQTDLEKLVVYRLPDEMPRSETFLLRTIDLLMLFKMFLGGLFAGSVALSIASVLSNRPVAIVYEYDFQFDALTSVIYYGALGALIISLAAAAFISHSIEKQMRKNWSYYYEQVPQGRVTKLSFELGRYCAYLEGNNRMNQLRTDLWPVNAKRWHNDVYVVDEYFDFTNEPRD